MSDMARTILRVTTPWRRLTPLAAELMRAARKAMLKLSFGSVGF